MSHSLALALPPTSFLADDTMSKLRRYFTARNHHPSADQWSALRDLADTLEAMAEGHAEPRLYLSSLDPGIGKSQTVVHFLDTLLARQDMEHVGVLLCVSRLTEVARMVNEIGIPPEWLAVITSDKDGLNKLGKAQPNEARVLITTQQMVERRLNGQPFENASLFHYRNEPRAVRVWDETYLPGTTITLNSDDLAAVLRLLTPLSADLRADVKAIFNEVDVLPSGSTYFVPDFAERRGRIELNDVLAMVDGAKDNDERRLRDDERAIVSALWFLSGKTVTVRRDGTLGNTVIDYKDTLPVDLAPMVILDASGRVRQTYRDMEAERGTLVRLRTATKRYDPLTVHLWQTGGGKRAFQTNGGKLVTGIAKTIDTKPGERWLVVYHRRDHKVGDVEREVRSLIAAPQENVSFLQWGSHSATNDFVDVPNVILAGTLFYRASYYEALKRLAADRPATKGRVSDTELRETELGEHAHLILQALCRGAVRRCDGDRCHPCNAYIIASVRSGIPAALPSIFPGCKVSRWKPIEWQRKGHAGAALDVIDRWLETAKAGDILPFKAIFKEVGITSHAFKYEVRAHPEFIEAVAEMGLVEWGKGRYFTGFRLEGKPLADA